VAEYRLYFLDKRGGIAAREEFCAPSDGDAVAIAGIVADACSEKYASFEIWSFARQVIGPLAAIPTVSFAEVSRGRQEQILQLEDAIHHSHWAVANSRRLLERTSELRALLELPGEARFAAQKA